MQFRIFLLGLLISSGVQAQNFIMKKRLADSYFNRFDYYKAIPMYQQLLKSSPGNFEVSYKLAESYRLINDARNEVKYYNPLLDSANNHPEIVLHYAQALAKTGDYAGSCQEYERYHRLVPDDERGSEFASAYRDLKEFYHDSSSYRVRKTVFSTESTEFSPSYYGDEIVFCSARESHSVIRFNYNRTQSSYLDLFMAYPDSSKINAFPEGVNTVYHEGPATFSRHLDTIIFTRSNYYHLRFKKSDDGIHKLKLYMASWDPVAKSWLNVQPMPFNNDQYSVGHPTLSKDGCTLYFVSDMPGGFGGTDIYVSRLEKDPAGVKKWSDPLNLGPRFNTKGNEMFPFIDKEGNLYFASDGIPGLGGLDIFYARGGDNGLSDPVNLGYPVNTSFDDFGYITSNLGKDAYLSSDRSNIVGKDDIYRVKQISQRIVVKIRNALNKQPLQAAGIYFTMEGSSQESKLSNINGCISITTVPGRSCHFQVSKDKFEAAELDLPADKLEELDTVFIDLNKKIPKFHLNGKVFSADNNNPMVGVKIYLLTAKDSTLAEANSDAAGAFSFDLSPESDYRIKVMITKPGSQCSSNTINRSTRGFSEDAIFNESFPVFCVGDIIKIENIYYDLGKFNIRPDAALELDKLLDLMNKYPNMKIELRSHTDSRGTASANLILSNKRAQAAAEYLFSKGIAHDRIIGRGYGDTMPLNRCVKGVKCSEEEYKVNRRTEFKILSVE